MLIYISIILTIHTLIGLYSVITSRIEQKRHRKMILGEIEERNKFFDELEKKLMENKVEEEMSDLLKLNNIAQRSGDIKTFPLSSNMKSAKYDKGPWGEVTIAIDIESIERLWSNDAIGILYIVGRDEWKKENEVEEG